MGENARVCLFGTLVDDDAKGGDIDLLINLGTGNWFFVLQLVKAF
jgi:predicted nucleotidyltransferase